MSKYNCRVKYVVPKDSIIINLKAARKVLDGYMQLGFTADIMGTCLCYYRFKRQEHHAWSRWMFYYPESYWQGKLCTYWHRPGWLKISNMLHATFKT